MARRMVRFKKVVYRTRSGRQSFKIRGRVARNLRPVRGKLLLFDHQHPDIVIADLAMLRQSEPGVIEFRGRIAAVRGNHPFHRYMGQLAAFIMLYTANNTQCAGFVNGVRAVSDRRQREGPDNDVVGVMHEFNLNNPLPNLELDDNDQNDELVPNMAVDLGAEQGAL